MKYQQLGPKRFHALLKSLVSKHKASAGTVLLCHQNADPDAVCSAIGLRSILERKVLGSDVKICCPGGVGASTKQLVENLGFPVPSERVPSGVELAILVDTNTVEQLGRAAGLLGESCEFVVVDHHHPHPDMEKCASLMIVDESAAAAAEVVYGLAVSGSMKLERPVALALLAAIFIETKHFILGRRATFEAAAGLVGLGADPRYLSEALSVPMTRSERIARLKAASRGQVFLFGEWIVVTSELGSYQSSAARGFLGLGAHLALVGGRSKEKTRVNMRATEAFHGKTGVHLGRDVAIPVGKMLGGAGGGHPTAAGLSSIADVPDSLTACVEKVRECLGPFQA